MTQAELIEVLLLLGYSAEEIGIRRPPRSRPVLVRRAA